MERKLYLEYGKMGILHFWKMVESFIERVPVSSIEHQTLAIDLAIWVVSDKSIVANHHHKGAVTKETRNFHVRQLFYRVKKLLKLNVTPIFVLDGAAPDAKLATIAQRLGVKSVKSNARSFLRAQFAPCCRLLDAMGVAWCQAPEEAEKLCAALNAAGLVDGVISRDGDCVCFGARRVYRSFSSENDAEIELLEMGKVEGKFTRFDFIACAILLGCDFFPGGIKGLGPVAAEKLLMEWKKKRKHPLHHMAQIKSGQRVAKHSKMEDKLYKLMANYNELDVLRIAKEFQITFDDQFMKKTADTSKTTVNIEQIAQQLTIILGWEDETSLQRALQFAFECGRVTSDIKLIEIVRKLRNSLKYEVKLSVSPKQSVCLIMLESEQLRRAKFAKELDKFDAKNQKLKKNVPVKSKLMTDFAVEKRKLDSPNRAPNPALLKRIQMDKKTNLSLGVDQLADSFDDSLDLDNYVPLSAKLKK